MSAIPATTAAQSAAASAPGKVLPPHAASVATRFHNVAIVSGKTLLQRPNSGSSSSYVTRLGAPNTAAETGRSALALAAIALTVVLLFGCESTSAAYVDGIAGETEAATECNDSSRAAGFDTSPISFPVVLPAGVFAESATQAATATAGYNASAEEVVPQIPAYIRTSAMCLCIVIMVLGVVGNVMVPIVIVKTKDMRNSTNIFLTNLSIADLFVLLVCTPTVLVEVVNTRPETWVLGHEMCKAVPFIELTVAHASVLTILAISFERYYAICEPLKAGYVCTKARAILICVLAWAVAALFTSPIILIATFRMEPYYDGTEVPTCFTAADTFWPAFFFVATIVVFFVLPLLVLLILYSAIAYKLLRRSDFHRATSPLKSSDESRLRRHDTLPQHRLNPHHRQSSAMHRHRQQAIFMLVAVVTSFFVCLLPFRVFTLWVIASEPEDIAALGLESYYNVLYACRIMLYLNSALNPILYNLMSSKFRNGFWRLILSCCGHAEHVRCARNTTCHRQFDTPPTLNSAQAIQRDSNFLFHSISTSSGTERSGSVSTSIAATGRRTTAVAAAIIDTTAGAVSTIYGHKT